jgi:hypothetical protein
MIRRTRTIAGRSAGFGLAIWLAACSGGGSGNASSGSTVTPSSGSATGSASGVSAPTSGTTSGAVASGSGAATDDAGGFAQPTDAGGVSMDAGACPNPTVSIVFEPMYSAFIPGSTAQTFSVPAIASDGNPATWSLSDPTQAILQTEAFVVNGVSTPGVLITMAGTGDSANQVTVIATESDGSCGTSVLTITPNTEDDWNIGTQRYNDGVNLHVANRPTGGGGPRDGGFDARPPGFEGGMPRPDAGMAVPIPADAGSYFETDGGTACTNCHGPTATNGPYKTVSHTPEQTGGFSDTDLQNIIWNGEIPDGGYFDPTVITPNCDGGAACTAYALAQWHGFHRWTDITADQLPGVICYLRSLTPQAQNGASNFGGGVRRRRDAGTAP